MRPLRGESRDLFAKELRARLQSENRWFGKLVVIRKKYLWMAVTKGTRVLKRVIDITFSLFFSVLFFPLIGILVIAIKAYDGGPVLHTSHRVGKFGNEFLFLKFRTMVVDAERKKEELISQNQHDDHKTFKIKNDPRITPIGRFLRRFSLDEIPQFWCVLKGDMSLVGPRPPLPSEVAQYGLEDRRRLSVKPGITCFWQVEGRSEIPFEQQKELDLQYIRSHNFWTDIRILLQTIPAVFFGKGAY